MGEYRDPWGPGGKFIEDGLRPVRASDIRGHSFFPTDRVMEQIPRLYATENVDLEDKFVHLHYFVGGCDWYLMEIDDEGELAFGYVNLNDEQNAELGYFDLTELSEIIITPDGREPLMVVERDLDWTPRKFSETNTR